MPNKVKRNVVKPSSDGAPTNAKQLAETVTAIGHQLDQIKLALLSLGLSTLTPEQRKHSAGKFREGESKAFEAILNTMDARPGIFASLAARDHGKNDQLVETQPTREALTRYELFAPLQPTLEEIGQLISDDVLTCGNRVKDVTVPAYGIIKVNAAFDPVVQTTAAKALEFYGAPAKTRAANQRKSKRQGAPPKPS